MIPTDDLRFLEPELIADRRKQKPEQAVRKFFPRKLGNGYLLRVFIPQNITV
jgi:hypothetical protein